MSPEMSSNPRPSPYEPCQLRHEIYVHTEDLLPISSLTSCTIYIHSTGSTIFLSQDIDRFHQHLKVRFGRRERFKIPAEKVRKIVEFYQQIVPRSSLAIHLDFGVRIILFSSTDVRNSTVLKRGHTARAVVKTRSRR